MYLDDILLLSLSFDEHINKCQFADLTIQFLRQVVPREHTKPEPSKIKSMKVKPPTNIKEMKQFPGTTGYYRKYYYAIVLC